MRSPSILGLAALCAAQWSVSNSLQFFVLYIGSSFCNLPLFKLETSAVQMDCVQPAVTSVCVKAVIVQLLYNADLVSNTQ